ncbi:hypothetical protein EG327_006916 [Venturia inaequalis]|uniref:DUF7730 domain-containing protein n=1 Tax=Venturia inaequalis TaxID=5025 RepID=A0A8H3V2A1_VENIN|nr:hypothetical protein EG327_006916 [Venturia inaequalis]
MKRKSTSTLRGPDGRFTKKARAARIQPAGDDGSPASVRTAPEFSETTGSKARLAVREEGMIDATTLPVQALIVSRLDDIRENQTAIVSHDVHPAHEAMNIDKDAFAKQVKKPADLQAGNDIDQPIEVINIRAPSHYLAQSEATIGDQLAVGSFAPTVTTKTNVKPKLTFMSLPLELRRQIYGYRLIRPEPIPIYRQKRIYAFTAGSENGSLQPGEIGGEKSRNLKPFVRNDKREKKLAYSEWATTVRIGGQNKSLLLVSRQIGEEALQVLYGDNQFFYAVGPRYQQRPNYTILTSSFSVSHLKSIRKLHLSLQFHGSFRSDVMNPTGLERTRYNAGNSQSVLWAPILDGLTKIMLVVKYPWRYTRRDVSWIPPLETRQQTHLACLETTLKFLKEHVSNDLKFDIDFGDRAEVRTVIDKCLLGRYSLVQTVSGDKFYDRNQPIHASL